MRKGNKKGFTLLEVVIAVALSVVVIATASLLYTSTVSLYRQDSRTSDNVNREISLLHSMVEGSVYLSGKKDVAIEVTDPITEGYSTLLNRFADNTQRSICLTNGVITLDEYDYEFEHIKGLSFDVDSEGALLITQFDYEYNGNSYSDRFVFYVASQIAIA